MPLIFLVLGGLGAVVGVRASTTLLDDTVLQQRYRVADESFFAEAKAFYERNKIAPGAVRMRPGETMYLLAQSWAYLPELRLQAGQRYVAWVASTDVRHGFLLRDQGLSFLLEPGYAYRVELLFEEPGTYAVSCNEYCGLGHAAMIGRIIVEGQP